MVAIVITATYVLRLLQRIFHGPFDEAKYGELTNARTTEWVTLVVLGGLAHPAGRLSLLADRPDRRQPGAAAVRGLTRTGMAECLRQLRPELLDLGAALLVILVDLVQARGSRRWHGLAQRGAWPSWLVVVLAGEWRTWRSPSPCGAAWW